MSEIWQPVVGYEDRYEVSDIGRVRSLGMYVNGINGCRPFRKGRILRAARKNNGYLQVTLCAADGSQKSILVHQLVCEAFHPRPPGADQVRHYDESDKTDNRAANLRWGDGVKNARDRERQNEYRLTHEQVREVRALRGIELQRIIGQRFGICTSHVSHVQLGRTRSRVE